MVKALFGWLGFCVVLLGMMGCTPREDFAVDERSEADVEAIKALMAKYVSGYASKDVDNFVNVFTEDAVRMPPNGPAIVGSEGIRSYYEDWFETETLDVKVAPTEIQVADDWAVAWGSYEATVTSVKDQTLNEDRGKWINVFKRGADGTWKFHRNIWNSDKPLPPSDDKAD